MDAPERLSHTIADASFGPPWWQLGSNESSQCGSLSRSTVHNQFHDLRFSGERMVDGTHSID